MPRRRRSEIVPPRLMNEAETADYLAMSPSEFSRRHAELEAKGFPKRSALLGGRDSHAIDLWLDVHFGLISTPEQRRQGALARIGEMGRGEGAH